MLLFAEVILVGLEVGPSSGLLWYIQHPSGFSTPGEANAFCGDHQYCAGVFFTAGVEVLWGQALGVQTLPKVVGG